MFTTIATVSSIKRNAGKLLNVELLINRNMNAYTLATNAHLYYISTPTPLSNTVISPWTASAYSFGASAVNGALGLHNWENPIVMYQTQLDAGLPTNYFMEIWQTGLRQTCTFSQTIANMKIGTYEFSVYFTPTKGGNYSSMQSINVTIGLTTIIEKTSFTNSGITTPWTKLTGTYNCVSIGNYTININIVMDSTANTVMYMSCASFKQTA